MPCGPFEHGSFADRHSIVNAFQISSECVAICCRSVPFVGVIGALSDGRLLCAYSIQLNRPILRSAKRTVGRAVCAGGKAVRARMLIQLSIQFTPNGQAVLV